MQCLSESRCVSVFGHEIVLGHGAGRSDRTARAQNTRRFPTTHITITSVPMLVKSRPVQPANHLGLNPKRIINCYVTRGGLCLLSVLYNVPLSCVTGTTHNKWGKRQPGISLPQLSKPQEKWYICSIRNLPRDKTLFLTLHHNGAAEYRLRLVDRPALAQLAKRSPLSTRAARLSVSP